MSFTYNNFLSFVKNDGLAKQNRFEVDIVLPVALRGNSLVTRHLTLLTKNVTVPGVNVATSEVMVVGEVTTAPYNRTFGEANMTFYVDKKFTVRKVFEDWINAIQDPESKLLGWYNDTITTVTINVLDKQEKTNFIIELHHARPKQLGSLLLDQSSSDMMTFDVSFDYKYYTTKYKAT